MKRRGLSTDPCIEIGKIRRKQKRSKEGKASGIGREPRDNNEAETKCFKLPVFPCD